ncbi:MAG: ornithine cyclodeaminase family protein [Chitinophagales bacterium]
MKYLNSEHLRQSISPLEVIAAVEKAMVLYETTNYFMPQRPHFDRNGNTLLLMPCFTASSFGTKLVSIFPNNTHHNLPAIQGLMILNDAKTGEPLAILDAGTLTALRTAAIGAVSIKYLAKKEVQSLGIIGTGRQGIEQAVFTSKVRPIRDIWLYNRSVEQLQKAESKLRKLLPNSKIHIAENTIQLLQNVKIVITSTNSENPVLPNDAELLKEKHYIGIGSYKPNMREFPQALFSLLKEIYTDTTYALQECGDLATPIAENWLQKEQVKRLGQVIEGKTIVAEASTTCYKSVGMALFDVMVAEQIYQKACEMGVGQDLI